MVLNRRFVFFSVCACVVVWEPLCLYVCMFVFVLSCICICICICVYSTIIPRTRVGYELLVFA